MKKFWKLYDKYGDDLFTGAVWIYVIIGHFALHTISHNVFIMIVILLNIRSLVVNRKHN